VYDLLNVPQWSWREVIAYEASRSGVSPLIETGAPAVAVTDRLVARTLRRAARRVASSRVAKERVTNLLTRFSPSLNARLQAVHRSARAAEEIGQLRERQPLSDAMRWNEVGTNPLMSIKPTATLLREGRFFPSIPERGVWPADIPPAV
jgi:hypothetical protein